MHSITTNSKTKPQTFTKKTLDTQHCIKMQQFLDNEKQIKELKETIQRLKSEYEAFQKKRQSSTEAFTDQDIEKMVSIQDTILSSEQDLRNLQTAANEIDYLTNTSDILFKYYDIVDKGSAHDEAMLMNKPASISSNSILKYLVKSSAEADGGTVPSPHSSNLQNNDKATLLEKYMAFTENNYVKAAEPYDVKGCCGSCGSTNRNIVLNDGLVYCNACHTVEYIIVDNDKPSYKDPAPEISYFSYKRINHLNEWISQIQGKETTEIPEEVYDQILLEIKKQKITNMAELTSAKIKSILKKLRIYKYYEHSVHIINKLNGLPTPHFDPELEEKLRSMFKQTQPLFLKYAPKTRKNFLSYSYVLHKFMQLLGKDEYLPYFHLLKSREKLHDQDKIWKNICEELNWGFIRSL